MQYNEGDVPAAVEPPQNDEEGSAAGSEEGEGDDVGADDDSSEEEEENEEEARKIQQGFIVGDEDEEEEEEASRDDSERRRRRRKKKRRRHRCQSAITVHESNSDNRVLADDEDDLDLDDDDIALLEENTGISRPKLTRVRRGRATSPTASPGPAFDRRRRGSVGPSELEHIFDDDVDERDERTDGMEVDEDEDEDDFIDDDELIDKAAPQEERRKGRKRPAQGRRALGARPEMAGIDAAYASFFAFAGICLTIYRRAWEEIFEVFGDGTDYDWALDGEEGEDVDEPRKPEMKYTDVSIIQMALLDCAE